MPGPDPRADLGSLLDLSRLISGQTFAIGSGYVADGRDERDADLRSATTYDGAVGMAPLDPIRDIVCGLLKIVLV